MVNQVEDDLHSNTIIQLYVSVFVSNKLIVYSIVFVKSVWIQSTKTSLYFSKGQMERKSSYNRDSISLRL